jgi:hypothetical protein
MSLKNYDKKESPTDIIQNDAINLNLDNVSMNPY